MTNFDLLKWNDKYNAKKQSETQPAKVLAGNYHLLPSSGVALDLACGLGGNAIFLAKFGFETHAWDISDTAIAKLRCKAKQVELTIRLEQRDISDRPPMPNSFDIIVISHFLERRIIKQIVSALKINGLLFYQTFTRRKIDIAGPKNLDYLLKRNELLMLFKPMKILFYREDDHAGELTLGDRNEAMLVAQKLHSLVK